MIERPRRATLALTEVMFEAREVCLGQMIELRLDLHHVCHTFHFPELVPPKQINVHVDSAFEWRNFGVEPSDIEE
jgi:hypothetical protein